MRIHFQNLLIVLLLTSPGLVGAQSKAPDKPATAKTDSTRDKPATSADSENVRALGLSLLNSLINDVNQFRDQPLRARSQARVADVLWEFDAEQGRGLFRKAWESAEIADQDSERRSQESTRQKSTTGTFAFVPPSHIREEVLRVAARRDRALGEELLEKLKADKEKKSATSNAFVNTLRKSWGMSEAVMQRLELAAQLLQAGDVERALQFAEPALATASVGGVDFLSNLRDKNPSEADRRYTTMLANGVLNPSSDANTISMLSAYLFTPHLFVTFNGRAHMINQSSAVTGPVDSPELRAAFFSTAVQIFLRPLPPPDEDQGVAGVEGKYLVMKRLLPIFEQYAPKETTESVRAQFEALGTVVGQSVREKDDEAIQIGITPDARGEDKERSLLEKIDHARTSAERDNLYLQLALRTVEKGEMRARDFADKIDESELRKSARAFVDAFLVIKAIGKKEADRALEIARTAELTHIQRVWVLAQAAKLFLKVNREKSLSLLDDALTEARRIGGSDPDRPRALFAVANGLSLADRSRALAVLVEAVSAANSAEGFTGADGRLDISVRGRGLASIQKQPVPDFDVAGIFELIASNNYNRAIELASGLRGEAPRVTATIAIVRSVLKRAVSTP